jgi:nucleoside-diphosphate-sugar epimerase
MDKVLVVGASGATGRLLVKILLQKNVIVVAIVRDSKALIHLADFHKSLQVFEAEITDMTENDLAVHIRGCDAVISCLGHNLTFKGMFGRPRRLVTDTIKKIALSIESINSDNVIKIILMNTTGNSNRDIPEKPPLSQRFVISLLRLLLPPHVDNEEAADYLRLHVGKTRKNTEWVAVRPDSLIDEAQVTPYEVFPSPVRNAIFDAAPTSRINVAEFMSELAVNAELWSKWKGQMPVIYNNV